MEVPSDNGKAIPVTILTGFLGAGKTTILSRILNSNDGLRVAVMVNDFGAINIDKDLIVDIKSDIISLANGCVCCQIRDDLVESVLDVVRRTPPVEYIILEASGVAEPGSIVLTFLDPNLRQHIRVDSVICIVDSEQVFANPEYPSLAELKLRQIAFSDLVILNKIDLVGTEDINRIKKWIDDRISNIRIIETNFCQVPSQIILGVGRFEPSKVIGNNNDSNDDSIHNIFETWSYTSDKPFSLNLLKDLAKKLPSSIYRCKGIIYSNDVPKRRIALQVVGRRVDISLLGEWNDTIPTSKIVAIGKTGEIEAEKLREKFETAHGS